MFKGHAVTGVLAALTGMVLLCDPGGAVPGAASADSPEGRATKSWRRPVALARSGDGRWLFVANQLGGCICVIDLRAKQVTAQFPIGPKIVDLAATKDYD